MDDQAKDIIATEVGNKLEDGMDFKQALDKVLSSNKSLAKSETWTEPTKNQRKAMRDRMVSDRRSKSFTINKKGEKDDVEYINVRGDTYKKVLKSDDVVKRVDGSLQLRASDGTFRDVIR